MSVYRTIGPLFFCFFFCFFFRVRKHQEMPSYEHQANFLTTCMIQLHEAYVYYVSCRLKINLLAGVPGVFSRGSPVFANLLIGPSHMS